MRAIVLVGGEATRMRPLSRRTPKQLMPVLGRPLIEHLLRHLAAHGVREVTLAMMRRNEAIREALGDGSRLGLRLDYAYEDEPLGSGGAIAQTAAGWTQPFFVLNGDILTDVDLGAMAEAHRRRGAELSLALREVEDTTGLGVVVIDEEDRVTRFVEKPPPESAPSRLVNAGIWLFEASLLDEMDAGQFNRVEDGLFPGMAAAGRGIYGYRFGGYWADVGSPATLRRVNLERADGEAVMGENVQVTPSATIGRPSVLGAGCRVEEAAVIDRSLLWDGVRVGAGAVVRESVLASGVTVGPRAVVERCVLAHEATVEAGAVMCDAAAEPGEHIGVAAAR